MNNYIVGNKDKTLFLGYNDDHGIYYTTDNIGGASFFTDIIGAKGLIKETKVDNKGEVSRLIGNYEYQKENWSLDTNAVAYAKQIMDEIIVRKELTDNAVIYQVEFILKEI